MEAIPWVRLLVDIIIPYKIIIEVYDKPLIIRSSSRIYSATGWFEILQYNNKLTAIISNLVDQSWLCRHQSPTITTHNHGNEFLGHSFNNNIHN